MKNIWDMTEDDIAIIKGSFYKRKRDFKKRQPTLGNVLIRELVNVKDEKDIKKFIRGIDVEIVEGAE